jgi:hypothetical protein
MSHIKLILKRVGIGIGTEVYQKVVVDENLRAHTNLSSLLLSCKTAGLAVAEYAGHALCCGGAPILYLHITSTLVCFI